MGLCCLVLGACAETAKGSPEIYSVRAEDTLYSIAWRHNLDFRDLARWNNIGADYRISVGQVLVLGPGREAPPAMPESAARPQGVPQVSKPHPLSSPEPSVVNPHVAAPPPQITGSRQPPAAQGAAVNGPRRWVWPTDRAGAPRQVPGGGILLSGRFGQDVRAASAGRVVYTGSSLRGYGNLIIIKHADSLLSAYAHNRELLVHDGQDVAAGQVIAHMGEGAHQSAVLYFELRQNGRPIDPMLFLPK